MYIQLLMQPPALSLLVCMCACTPWVVEVRIYTYWMHTYVVSGVYHMVVCSLRRPCTLWHVFIVAPIQLGELENAMDALCEANILNNHDSIVWAYLALVSAKVRLYVYELHFLLFVYSTYCTHLLCLVFVTTYSMTHLPMYVPSHSSFK